MTSHGSPMVDVANLCAYYGKLQALWGIDITVEAGEIVAVLGPNGAGKSTLLRSLSGIRARRTGSCKFLGEDTSRLAAHQIVERGMVHVPEGRQVFRTMSVDDNLDMGAYLVRDRRLVETRREWVFELFPVLQDRRSGMAGNLSGGEQQMLAIARALMAGPKVMLIDEPSLGLAPVMTQAIFAVLRRISGDGVGVLLAEQQVAAALQIAHRGYVLSQGHIARQGDSASLLAAPDVVGALYLKK